MNENTNVLSEYMEQTRFGYQDVAMQAAWREALQRWPLLQEVSEHSEQGAEM